MITDIPKSSVPISSVSTVSSSFLLFLSVSSPSVAVVSAAICSSRALITFSSSLRYLSSVKNVITSSVLNLERVILFSSSVTESAVASEISSSETIHIVSVFAVSDAACEISSSTSSSVLPEQAVKIAESDMTRHKTKHISLFFMLYPPKIQVLRQKIGRESLISILLHFTLFSEICQVNFL